MSQRIELSFWVRLKELSLFFFWKIWVTELNLFFKMIHRIEPFLVWLKEYFNFTRYITQRIKSSFLDSKTWTVFLFINTKKRINELNLFEYDAKNRTLFQKWPIELNLFLWTLTNMIHRIELIFSIWHRFEFLSIRLKELNILFEIWVTELNLFWKMDSKNWTLFSIWPQELNPFKTWLKELNHFLPNMTQRIEPFFFSWGGCDSKNWTFFEKYVSLWEFNTFEPFHVTQRIVLFHMTQRLGVFFFKNLTFMNRTFFPVWLKELTLFFFSTTQRIEFFLETTTQRIEIFSLQKTTQRIVLFSIWLKNLSFFLQKKRPSRIQLFEKDDSKNWTFFWVWLKELNPFQKRLKE